ncbi:hypothetical protein, partial [Herbiconiux daphne]
FDELTNPSPYTGEVKFIDGHPDSAAPASVPDDSLSIPKSGKATGFKAIHATPPAYVAKVPQPLPAVAHANPAAPVIKTPQKQTQGGGVWAKAPDIKGTFAGDSTTVIRNQNMVQAQRPSTPMIVNPDVIGQPVSTTVITKNTDTMAQGHNDPTGVPVETVTHNLPAPQPAAQDGIKDTPVHYTTTY